MINIYGVASSIAVATLLIGCAAQPPAPPMAAAAPVAATPITASTSGGLDGVYRGPEGGVSGNAKCTRKFGPPIRVTGGVASLTTAITGALEGPVAPDGSLAVQSGRAALSGQFANGTFNGTYSYNGCSYALNYTKR